MPFSSSVYSIEELKASFLALSLAKNTSSIISSKLLFPQFMEYPILNSMSISLFRLFNLILLKLSSLSKSSIISSLSLLLIAIKNSSPPYTPYKFLEDKLFDSLINPLPNSLKT